MELKLPKDYKYIAAFLTMRCNLNCSFCLNNLEKSKGFNRTSFKEMSGKEWVEALNRLKTPPNVPITFSGGEPMLHPDFIYIINNLKPSLNIDILTNFYNKRLVDKFIKQVDPIRVSRPAPYPSIRVSYHPAQMDPKILIENVKRAQDAGFSIGIFSVLYPSSEQLSAIVQMQFLCKEAGIDFRVKDFTGSYKGEIYGDYSKYPDSYSGKPRKCKCKTSELIVGPNGNVYKCHRNLYKEEFPLGSLLDKKFIVKSEYRNCSRYGECHPCDVKCKTSYKQKLGHTSVEIKVV